jgi:hypothetical protein
MKTPNRGQTAVVQPPSEESTETRFQKAWLSPSGGLHYLDGLIHEQWARLAIGSDVSAPMPQDGGENAKQKLFELDWIRVALLGSDTIVIEHDEKGCLAKVQSERLIELALAVKAKYLVRESGGKMKTIWSRGKT